MRTDSEIQKDVMEELNWEAAINAIRPTEIGVAVKKGIVTLTGTLDSYSKKIAAEKAAIRVTGVKAIANDINIKLWNGFEKNDTEIAEAILYAIRWSTSIPEDKVKARVEKGWVTLEGDVEWEFQKTAANDVVEDLMGVKGVTNLIKVVSKVTTTREIKEKIIASIQRNAITDAKKIKVELNGNTVTLRGQVRSMAERKDAESAAWSAPGIIQVENHLEISYPMAYSAL